MSPEKDKEGPKEEKKRPAPSEKRIDKTLDESFPASDPPAWTGTHAGDVHSHTPEEKKP